MHHLRQRWEAYLRVPLDASSRQMKLRELEKFLHAVLKWTAEENEVPQFGDMRSVSNILAGEFLVDIHRICSESEEEDVTQLQEYLLSGRGSVILKVLGTIGVKGLSCARELGELLVSLLPMCMKFPAEHPKATKEVQLCGMEGCFVNLSVVRSPSSPAKFPELTEVGRQTGPTRPWGRSAATSSTTESAFFRSLHYHHHHQKHRRSHNQSSSESGDNEEPPSFYGRFRTTTPAPKLLENSPNHLGVFPGVIHGQSSTEELSGVFSEDGDAEDLPKLQTNAVDLCILLLTLLKDLSHDDGPQVDNKKSVSMSLMPSLAHLFNGFHLENNSASEAESGSDTEDGEAGELPEGWLPKDLIVLERYMVRVLNTMANNVSEQSNGLTVLLANGALATILDVAWSVVKEMEANKTTCFTQDSAKFIDQLNLVSDIVHGCWLLMQSIFTNIPLNPSILKTALKLFHDVVANHGLQLAECVLLQWEKLITISETLSPHELQCAKDTVVSIVSTMSRVIIALKKSKIDYIHAVKCSRRRHKRCDYSNYTHHHHDILGLSGLGDQDFVESTGYGSMEALNPPTHNLGGSHVCAVSALGEFILQLYQKSMAKVLQVRLLRCLEEAGLCCCMLPSNIIKMLLLNIEAQSSAVRNFILSVLVRVLLDQCGGAASVQSKHDICNICRDDDSHEQASDSSNTGSSTKTRRAVLIRRQETSDSALSGSDASLPEDGPAIAPKWRCFKHFQPLILGDEEEMNVQAMQHMLRFVSQGSSTLLQELFYCIFLPVLQASRQQFLKPEQDSIAPVEWEFESEISTGVVQYCLSALPVLLQSTSVHDMFLNYGGVKQLTQLVQVDSLRQCVLKVFQVLIVLDEKKQLQDNQGVLYLQYDAGNTDDDIAPQCEKTLSSSPKITTEKLPVGKLEFATVLDAFIELLFQGMQRTCSVEPASESDSDRKCADGGNLIPKELSKLCDIWIACDGLFTQSRKFKHEFLRRDGPASAHDILRESLKRLKTASKDNIGHFSIYSTDVNSEFGCVLALAQSTLNVCLTCCNNKALFSSEELPLHTLLEEVKGLVLESDLLNCVNLNVVKVMFDMLLSCSTAKYSPDGKHDIVQNHTLAVMHLRGDEPIYDHELQELSDPCSARETEPCFTEQGYEADSEFTPEEHGKGHTKKNGARRRMRPISNTLAYPELCHLVLQLLIKFRNTREDSLTVVPHVLLKLISLAKHSGQGTSMLYEQGVVPTLLKGFHQAIVSKEPKHQVEQRLALDLFTVISKNSFSSHDLKNFIMLLQQPRVAVDGILSTLILLTESQKLQPTYYLHFPVIKSMLGNDFEISVRSLSSDCLTASVRQITPQTVDLGHTAFTDLSMQLKSASGALQWKAGAFRDNTTSGNHVDSGTLDNPIPGATSKSPANCAPMQVTLRDNMVWPTNQKGFSLSLWVKIVSNVQDLDRDENFHSVNGEKKQAFSKGRSSPLNPYKARHLPAQLKATLRRSLASRHWSDSCLHLVSLGNKDKMLEVWTDPEVANLIFRLVSHHRDEERVLSEATINTHIEQDTWQHLTLTYSERVQGMEGIRTLGTVTTIVDGCFQKEVSLEYMNNFMNSTSTNDSRLFIGHGVSLNEIDHATGSWQLGNLFLFKDTLVTKHISFHLYALGPDCVTLSECDSTDMTAEYTHHISEDVVLHSGLSHDVFTGNHSIYLHHLRENLIVAYHPKAATDFCLYNQPSPFKPEKTSGLKNILSSSTVRGTFNPKMHQPTKVPARLLTDIAPKTQKGLRAAINEIGGIGVFLFMFAKVVELHSTEKQQAEALQLLFTLMRNDPNNAHAFINMSGYEMLTKVFASSKSIMGFQILKVLLDKCTTKPLLNYSRTCGEYQLNKDSEALICDVNIVTSILLAWRVWEKTDMDVWDTAFKALEILLREDHPHRDFNIRQLHSAGLIEKMLNMCLERLQDAIPSLPLPICQSLVNIIHQLMGNPPDVHDIVVLCDFLLLTHPAASTYVNHTPNRFYFAPKWRRTRKRISQSSASASTESTGMNSLQTSISLSAATANSTPMKQDVLSEMTTSESSPEEHGKLEEILDANHVSLQRSQSLPESMSWWQKQLQHLVGDGESPKTQREQRKRAETFPRISRAQTDVRVLKEVELRDFRMRDSVSLMADSHRDAHSTETNVLNLNKPDTSPNTSDDKENTEFYLDFNNEWPIGRRSRDCKSASPVLQHAASDVTDNMSDTRDANSSQSPPYTPSRTNSVLSNPSEEFWGNPPLSPASNTSEDWTMYTNTTSLKSVPVRINSEGEEDSIEHGEEGLVQTCAGIIQLLVQVLVALPDSDLKKILGVILKPEMMIVMAHHNSVEIRTAVVQLLDIYLHRATKEQEDSFLKIQGFHLLASQLHQHAATTELAEACVTILLGRPHNLEDDLDSGMLCDLRPVQQMAIVPILALIENSVLETSLCHNLLTLVHQVFRGIPSMAIVMLCNGLMETLCNATHTLNAQPARPTDLGGDEKQLLLADLQQIFCSVAEKTFSTSGISYYQYMEDSISQLLMLENRQYGLYGIESEELQNMKILYCCFLQAIFDHINGKLDTPSGFQLRKSSITNAVGSFLSKFNPIVDPELGIGMPASYKYKQAQAMSMPSSLSMLTTGLPYMIHPSGFTVSGNRVRSHSVNEHSRRLSSQTNMDIFAAALLGGKKATLTQNELLERFKKILTISVDYALYSVAHTAAKTASEQRLSELVENSIEVVAMEKEFARSLLEFLLKAIIIGMERSFFQRKSTNTTVMWQAKDVLRVQFCRLIVHMMSPSQDIQQRMFAVSLLANESKCKEVLKLTVPINHTGKRLACHVYDMLLKNAGRLDRGQRDEADELMTYLQQCGITPVRLGSRISREQMAKMEEEKTSLENEYKREKRVWLRKLDTTGHRILHKLDHLAKKISSLAMDVTQTVNNTQNSERKKFLEHVKKQMSNGLQVKKSWQQLIQQLSHERAVWHCPYSYPPSWQLDPTEGPCRTRKRLQRCHLRIAPRYLKEDYQGKLDAENYNPPLSYLFEEDNLNSDSAALIYKLHTSENIQHTCMCTSVTPSSETTGALLIGQNDIYFVADEVLMDANYTQPLLGDKDLLFMILPHEDVKEIHKRWNQLKDNALEIFLTNGKTTMLAFSNTRERDQIYSHLTSLELPNLLSGENLNAILQLWLDGKMTNFEYLTHLNKISGRSFNDLMQYPVFPFVLSNYDQDVLDIDDPTSYRNLSKPIAVQHKSREQRYTDNYKWLANEKKSCEPSEIEYRPEPYHYGSHYSNSGSVLHFLVRLPPFTQMFLHYQDRNFDLPDRTFHDTQTSWRLASFESTTDVKELIPEFFNFPEFLNNTEGFDLGVRQGGQKVWDVGLPPWCPENNPRMFTLIHRQALESECVSMHLANWIDLVFGFKQTGKPAIEAVNVFHPATYFGKDVDSVTDPVRRQALKTMIKTYGQTPRQLFRSPHPILQGTGLGMAMWGGEKPRLSRHRLNPVKTVKGLKWGMFVGSPDLQDPMQTWLQNHGSVVESLVALPTGEVFGIGANSSLLVMYSKEKGVTSVNTVDVLWAAIISWSHPDCIIRVKNRKDLPAINFLNWSTDDQVTCCASVPDCRLLFFGSTSGVISVHNTKFNSSKQSHLQVFGRKLCLYGHSAAISALNVCKAYSVLVSGSHDNTCIIWDLNRLTYVTSITDHTHPVHTLAVSETLGDIASVSHTDQGSSLKLHTINGEKVAEYTCRELILCLAYSTLPEGRAVNVLVGGLNNGTIRMWSSWDMMPIRDILSPKFTYPIVSITFTHDCQKLFAANSDGAVAVWEKASNSRAKDVAFIPFL